MIIARIVTANLMEALTSEQCEELGQQLLTLQTELERLLASSEEAAKPVGLDQPIGRLSRMDAMQQQSMVQANRRAAQQRSSLVTRALRRLEGDEYGLCTECDENIGFPRLKARPETPLCINCQSHREK